MEKFIHNKRRGTHLLSVKDKEMEANPGFQIWIQEAVINLQFVEMENLTGIISSTVKLHINC